MGRSAWLRIVIIFFWYLASSNVCYLATAQAAVIKEHSGRLTTESGAAVKGPVNLELLLYRRETGGDPLLPAPLIFNNVALDDGKFNIQVELSSADSVVVFGARGDTKVWVQILDQTNDRVYPRQRMTGAPEMVTAITRTKDASTPLERRAIETASQTTTSTSTATSSDIVGTTAIVSSSSTMAQTATAPETQPILSQDLTTSTASSSTSSSLPTSTPLTGAPASTDTNSAAVATISTNMNTDTASAAEPSTSVSTVIETNSPATYDVTSSDTSVATEVTTSADHTSQETNLDDNSLLLNLPTASFIESPLNPEPSPARAELGTIGRCGVDQLSSGEVLFSTPFTQGPWVFLQAGDSQTTACIPQLVERKSDRFSWTIDKSLFAMTGCSCIYWMAVGR